MKRLLLFAAMSAGISAGQAYAQALPRIDKIVNAANYTTNLGTGGWATVFGDFPITTPCIASDPVIPTTLCNTTITVNGTPTPAYYADKNQLNIALLTTMTGAATVVVQSGGKTSKPYTTSIDSIALGLFQRGAHLAAIVTGDGRILGPDTPLDNTLPDNAPGRVISIYATGGGTNNKLTVPPGAPVPADQLYTTPTPTISLDGQPLTVLFSGLAPGSVGENQYNTIIPKVLHDGSLLTDGAHTLVVSITNAGKTSSDKADIITAPLGTAYLSGCLSSADNTEAVISGTLTKNNNPQSFTSTPLGTILIPNPQLPATLVVDGATQKFAQLTIQVPAKTTQLTRKLIPWGEDPNVDRTYTPQSWADINYLQFPDPIPMRMFTTGTQGVNSAMIQNYMALWQDGTYKPNLLGKYPVPIYLGNLPTWMQLTLNACKDPWNTDNTQFTTTVDEDPTDPNKLAIVPTTHTGISEQYWSPDTTIQTINGMRVATSGTSIIELAANSPQEELCDVYTHELGHALGYKHQPDPSYVMWYKTTDDKNWMTHAPKMETTWQEHHVGLGMAYNPVEHSWTQSTNPINGATYQPTR